MNRDRRFLVAALGLAGLLLLGGCRQTARVAPGATTEADRAAAAETREPGADEPEAADPAAAWIRDSVEIRPGEPLDLALRRLDLEPAERQSVVAALSQEVDPRRVLPGEQLEIARDLEGAVRETVLQRDRLTCVVARFLDGDAPAVEEVLREPEISVCSVTGRLDGSLYESVLESGGDANLVMRYADLLAWQVDFLTEPRPGDTFRILVERERLDGEDLGYGKILAAEYRGARASARAIRYEDSAGELDWYDDNGESVRRAFLKSPLHYSRISSGFTANRRHPILKRVMPHWGVDYAAPQGTPVSALGSGVIEFAGRKGGYGNYIEVRHNSTYTTCYGHLWKFAKGIQRGVRVEQGQLIGYVGSTGLSTGPHLDFRVKKNRGFVDPLRLESPAGRSIEPSEKPRFEETRDRLWRLAAVLDREVPREQAWAMVTGEPAHRAMLTFAP